MGAYKSKLSVLYGNFSYSTNSMTLVLRSETMIYMAKQPPAVFLMHCKAIRMLAVFGRCLCFRDSFLMQMGLKILKK